MLVVVGVALGARGYTDRAGDVNAAPDITSVGVSEALTGTLTFRLAIGNYQTLPARSWVNLWFDIDSNPGTGGGGDEALVQYVDDGTVEVYLWDGSRFVEGTTDGVSGSFTSGALTLAVPRVAVRVADAFGVLAITSRAQVVGNQELIASDFAPDVGRSAYAGTAAAAFPDAANDQDAAPDMTAIRVSDAQNGWITFEITTPNYATLPSESALILEIDADNDQTTGDGGAEARINMLGGEVSLERWSSRSRAWVPDELPTRARYRSLEGLATIDVHRSELANTQRFGFALLSADVNSAAFEVLAVDLSPDNGSYWRYVLANWPALRLVPTRLYTTPNKPVAGKPLSVSLGVRRSDTNRPVTSGSVGCRVVLGGSTLPSTGAIVSGGGRCSFRVPAGTQGSIVRGTITVRSGGKTVAADFAYAVR